MRRAFGPFGVDVWEDVVKRRPYIALVGFGESGRVTRMNIENVLATLLTGLAAGCLVSAFTRSGRVWVAVNAVVGIGGAFASTWLFLQAGVKATQWTGSILIAVHGAVLFLWLLHFLRGKFRKK